MIVQDVEKVLARIISVENIRTGGIKALELEKLAMGQIVL
jgi:hypothetical protein